MNNEEALKVYFENLLSYVDYEGIDEEEDLDKDITESNLDEIEYFEENFENIHCEDSIEEVTSFIIVNDDENSSSDDILPEILENFFDDNLMLSGDDFSINEDIPEVTDNIIIEESTHVPNGTLPNQSNYITESNDLPLDNSLIESPSIDLSNEAPISLLHFYSTLNLSISILQRKNSHFLSSNSEATEFEHLSLILDFKNEIKINYTLTVNLPFEKITSISNDVSILKSYIIYDTNQGSYYLSINGLINKRLSFICNDITTVHTEKVSFEKIFEIQPSKPLQRFTPNNPITIYPFTKKFLDEHKLCMNILNSNIKENFKIERKP